jgi:predicted GIY-YIG superfamily endonuclease
MALQERQRAVYLMASRRNGTVYVGVTSNLVRRAAQHRDGTIPGFTSRHRCQSLVWFELHADMIAAMTREKQIMAGSRKKKLALIEAATPSKSILSHLQLVAPPKH